MGLSVAALLIATAWGVAPVDAFASALWTAPSATAKTKANSTMVRDISMVFSPNDLSSIFYRSYNSGAIVPPVKLATQTELPVDIADRLIEYGLKFDEMDGYLQRALLWDEGYAVQTQANDVSTSGLLKIYTKTGVSMSGLTLSRGDVEGSGGCAIQSCSSPEYGATWRAVQCTREFIMSASRCAIDPRTTTVQSIASVEPVNRARSVWAIRDTSVDVQNSTAAKGYATPEVNIVGHYFSELTGGSGPSSDSNGAYDFYTIHAIPFNLEPLVGQCPSQQVDSEGLLPSLIIPCLAYDTVTQTTGMDVQWGKPDTGDLLTVWLQSVAAERPVAKSPDNTPSAGDTYLPDPQSSSDTLTSSNKPFNLLFLIPVVVGVLAFAAILIGFVVFRRKQSNSTESPRPQGKARAMFDDDDALYHAHLSPAAATKMPKQAPPNDQGSDFAFARKGSGDRRKSIPMVPLRRNSSEPYSSGSYAGLDADQVRLLQTDPNLSSSRISYDKIVFDRVLSRSLRYEVWLCQYEGEELAVKRLASCFDEQTEAEANLIDAFIAEIQISAALEHPNLARFVGVAWAHYPADSLCLAIEYQSNGDLRRFLQKYQDSLNWKKHKLPWARGIARGMSYLHSKSPPVLHSELNSTHVLLSDHLEPKLIDFGERHYAEDWTNLKLSKDNLYSQNVSFPYWAAPEVLRGELHRPSSDVYSFGMMLLEIHTGTIPYQDVHNTSSGKKLKPFQLFNMVLAGRLKPKIPASCPPEIRSIIKKCVQSDPAERPSMPLVHKMLQKAKMETQV
ncbi:hypothetical protein Poli38472_011974 [Pythium oligandrum]|uniref:Protein kinase domain-containing protein n=1 Tax=Pythium oligandrum TaxID=41045 RepID=A0A8K1CPY3_PYTOL|nr:hypothetical protein Poli38472_011974 [Pythium oligandrum]|eukprot:TMW66858.1 hypothetical protein Poli38472_011974 [Pythium oligandrum]